jgi:hypothetical protein
MGSNESVFAMAGYSVFRHTGTEVDFYFIVEDTFCRLIINCQARTPACVAQSGREADQSFAADCSSLPPIFGASPAIANTFCACCTTKISTPCECSK